MLEIKLELSAGRVPHGSSCGCLVRTVRRQQCTNLGPAALRDEGGGDRGGKLMTSFRRMGRGGQLRTVFGQRELVWRLELDLGGGVADLAGGAARQ